MDIENLTAIVIDALEDIKAQDIKLFDTTPLTSLFERVAIVSGTSNRQTRSLAAHVRDKVKEAGAPVLSVEGEDTGEWVLVDLGDMVVHIMQTAIRSYYNLEELWGEFPLPLKPEPEKLKGRGTGKSKLKLENEIADEEAAAKQAVVKKPIPKGTGRQAQALAGRAPRKELNKELAPLKPATKGGLKTQTVSADDEPVKGSARKVYGPRLEPRSRPTTRSAPSKTGTGQSAIGKAATGKTVASKTAAGRVVAGKAPGAKTTGLRSTALKSAPKRSTTRKPSAK